MSRKRRAAGESESRFIDRIILGLPNNVALVAKMRAMLADGLTQAEAGARFGMKKDAVAKRLERADPPRPVDFRCGYCSLPAPFASMWIGGIPVHDRCHALNAGDNE